MPIQHSLPYTHTHNVQSKPKPTLPILQLAVDEKLYCFCQQPYSDGQFMVECEDCKEWFHPACLNITKQEAQRSASARFSCPKCAYNSGERFVFRDKLPPKRRSRFKYPSLAEVNALLAEASSMVIMREHEMIKLHVQNAK
eukprot:1117934-Amorphochlora_amoeboformis.AAC.1